MKIHMKIRDMIHAYVDDNMGKAVKKTASAAGHTYTICNDGKLYLDGKLIMQVICKDSNRSIPTVLVLEKYSGTSLCYEVNVVSLDGPDHEENYKYFMSRISNVVLGNMSIVPKFIVALGIRRGAIEYAKHFKIPHLPISPPEMVALSRAKILGEVSPDRIDDIVGSYRRAYGLSEDATLDAIPSSTPP